MSELPLIRHGPRRGQPVLFLHGFMGAAAVWESITERLNEEAYSLCVDLPGHGMATERPSEDYTMVGGAACLASTLEAEAVRPPVVVGYSMGGRLALYFALTYPEYCRGLVLESASPGLQTEEERAARRRTDADRACRIQEDFGTFLDDWYHMPLFASLARHDLVDAAIAKRLKNDPGELARSLEGMSPGRQPSLWARLVELPVPAVVLTGALDEKYRRLTRAMAERAEGRLRRVLIARAGHNIHAERPARFAAFLKEFLREIRN